MLDRKREQESDHGAKRDRVPAPPPAPPQFGTLAWASAVGNHAVARLARQSVEEAPPAEEATEEAPPAEEATEEAPPADAPAATAEEAGPTEEESPDTEDLPEALPE